MFTVLFRVQNADGNPLSNIGSALQGAASAVSSAVSAASPALAPLDLTRTNPVQVLPMSVSVNSGSLL